MAVLFVDIGSNTIKALLAEFEGGALAPLGEFSVPNRISSISGLKSDAPDIILDSVKELEARARGVRQNFGECLFGTSALRSSKNAPEVLKSLEARGVKIRVLSGDEEAELSFCGALEDADLNLAPGGGAVYGDLGGGSMEIVVREGGQALRLLSLPIGAVRITNAFSANSVLDIKKAAEFCAENFSKMELPKGDFSVICAGGALSAARVMLGGGVLRGRNVLTRGDFEFCLNECLNLGAGGICEKYGVLKNRAEILPAAFVCLLGFLIRAGRRELVHARTSLRYGVAKKYFEGKL
ncbi:MAG: hypothetical protein J6P03_08280 [Opitutales bacterium]|nr:hypothetical protein [Opitutales bacterium]